MATTFTSGSKSGLANAAALGQSIAEQFRDDLVAHAAWELVEEVTPGTMHWYVFRCLSASSGLPADFYLIMGRVISTGVLQWFIAEGYNDTTNVASLYPTNNASGAANTSTYTYDSSGRQTSHTFTLSTSAITNSNNQPRGHTWTPSGTSSNYWIMAREDGCTINLDGANDAFMTCGAFEWLASTANAMPVLSQGTNGIQGQNGFMTRNPLCISGSFSHWATTLDATPGTLNNDDLYLGFPGTLQIADAMNGGIGSTSEIGVRIAVHTTASHVSAANVIGEFLGKYKHIRIGRSAASATFGDAYEMDGTLWVPQRYGTTSEDGGVLHDTLVPA